MIHPLLLLIFEVNHWGIIAQLPALFQNMFYRLDFFLISILTNFVVFVNVQSPGVTQDIYCQQISCD